eukprot:TRINITY_DN10444_c0_g3_i1.p1 TRINITY_DN10444_c0_g3~~TRINITY_DN10444_c0_g3_i1.p1  ORF type:complete len:482 (-),score=-3.74 TRINITY_DN10444_c0_g3_i1:49-1494(-)
MCELRGLWVLRDTSGEVLFSRRYPSVELRIKALIGDAYVCIPSDAELVRLFRHKTNADIEVTGSCVIELNSMWPLVYTHKSGAFYCAILADCNYSTPQYSLINRPAITACLLLLEDIISLVSPYAPLYKASQFAELHVFLMHALPFGRPIESSKYILKMQIKQGNAILDPLTQKHPAWRPHTFKGRQQLDLTIRESIVCVQYDHPLVADTWSVSGSVLCRAELEGLPEVTAFIVPPASSTPPEINFISVDPCVQAELDPTHSNKFVFVPPLDPFNLCTYGVSRMNRIPLRGFYQMKEISPNVVKILVQLKLDSDTNQFEYCVMHIPFKGRGFISGVQMSPTAGSVALDPSQTMLVWNIGQKFTGKNLEVALPAEISFSNQISNTTLLSSSTSGWLSPPALAATETAALEELRSDPFCTGENTYVKLHFKIVGSNLSGLTVDLKRLSLFPNAKVKAGVEHEICSSDYTIWNSLGQGRMCTSA